MKFPKKKDMVTKFDEDQEKIKSALHVRICTKMEKDFVPGQTMFFTVPKELTSEKLDELIESCRASGWIVDLEQGTEDFSDLELSIR